MRFLLLWSHQDTLAFLCSRRVTSSWAVCCELHAACTLADILRSASFKSSEDVPSTWINFASVRFKLADNDDIDISRFDA